MDKIRQAIKGNKPQPSSTLGRLIGSKQVSFFTGVCLLVNAMTGPSIPFTPALFQNGGILPPMVLFFVFTILSTLSCLFIVEAMQSIPGNAHFQGTVEFATLVNFYFGGKSHILAQICLYGAIQSNAIQSIVLSVQTIDNILVDTIGKTCALSPELGWFCVNQTSETSSPFGDEFIFFSLGVIIVLLLAAPLGILNLDDNMILQVGAFVITGIIILQWVIASILYKFNGHDPIDDPVVKPIGTGLEKLLGTVLLSMAFTFVVPSWVNLKKKEVNAQKTLWTSSIVTCLLYLIIGIIPAICFPQVDADSDGSILPLLSSRGVPPLLTKISVYSFSIVMLLPSIPVSCIVSRNNLVQNKVVGNKLAAFLTFIVPWFAAIPMLTGPLMNDFQNWSSLLFVSTANFIVPVIVYLRCNVFRKAYNEDKSILSDKQLGLLKQIHYQSHAITAWVDYNGTGDNKRKSFNGKDCIDSKDQKNIEAGITDILAGHLDQRIPDPEEEDLEIETLRKRNSKNPDVPLGITISSKATIDPRDHQESVDPPTPSPLLSPSIPTTPLESMHSTSSHGSLIICFSKLEKRDPDFYKHMSLPIHPGFISTAFRALPRFITSRIKTGMIAMACMSLTTVVVIVNLITLVMDLVGSKH